VSGESLDDAEAEPEAAGSFLSKILKMGDDD